MYGSQQAQVQINTAGLNIYDKVDLELSFDIKWNYMWE